MTNLANKIKYAFIGDIHSQVKPLEQALAHCRDNNLTPIFLGDLFDSQCDVSDAPTVYRLVRESQEDLGSIILRSNHQHLLEKLARNEQVPLRKDFARTVREFAESDICIREVAQWLETFPYVVVFRDSKNQEYRVAHAEIPSSVTVPEYETMWMYYEPRPEEVRPLLWGADYSLPDKERFWWAQGREHDWVTVAGHYHKVVQSEKFLVLDAGCGGKTRAWYDKRPPELLLYEVESKELKSFSCL